MWAPTLTMQRGGGVAIGEGALTKVSAQLPSREVYMMQLRPPVVRGMDATIFTMLQPLSTADRPFPTFGKDREPGLGLQD